jgi:uridine kinase
LALQLSKHLSASLILQDDFYIGAQAMRASGKSIDNFDTLDALDSKGLIANLDVIHAATVKTIEVPNYDYVRQAPSGFRSVSNTDTVVVEGHLIFTSEEILNYVDFLIYVDIEEHIAKERRFLRDVVERGYDAQECESYYIKYVLPQIKNIEKLKIKADYVLSNDTGISELGDHVLEICACLKD